MTEFKTSSGSIKNIEPAAMDQFRTQLTGGVVTESDANYNEVRALWNGMIDRKPAAIARCMGTADVISCVKFARENDLVISVRGGGHNIAGTASADGALMIDLSLMKYVWVNPQEHKARVSAGATLRNVDHETQAFGLATPTGINSTTGIAGLTLGGGFGWLSRSFGLTADNLLSAEIVTAEGIVIRASERENADLLWGIRGGGGNFGVVTSFQFKLHPAGPQVLAGLIVHPFKNAAAVLKYYREFASQAPDNLTCWAVLRKAPPLPFLPEEEHGKEVLVLANMYTGDIKEGEKVLDPLRKFGQPLADIIAPMPFESWQQALDPLLAPGARNYWKSHNFISLQDGFIDTLIEYTSKLPSVHSEIFIGQLGGAINRVAPDATAYPHRDANYIMNIHARWEDKASDDQCISWARKLFDQTAQYATGGVYVNFISEGENRVASAFGPNFPRLAALKKKYDPSNFFRSNQNITPG